MANEVITNTLLTTSTTIAHTVSGAQVALSIALDFLNIDSAIRKVNVWLVPNGETLGTQHLIMPAIPIRAGKTLSLLYQGHLQAGDVIHWSTDDSNKVNGKGSVAEVTKNGHENIPAQFLGTSLATLHTVTTGYEMTLCHLLLGNQDTVPRGAEIQLIPQGQSAASKHRYLSTDDKIPPNVTRSFRWPNRFLGAGGVVQGLAEATSAIVVAGGIFEEAT